MRTAASSMAASVTRLVAVAAVAPLSGSGSDSALGSDSGSAPTWLWS